MNFPQSVSRCWQHWNQRIVTLLVASLALIIVEMASAQGDRPNILWITAEDMSPTLGCYGDAYAITPHIDRLAAQSVKYSHAFATAPVCSPSRATLINGLMASTQGSHQMRSTYPLPGEMIGFPKLFRDMGYFTSNNVKTDYNSGNAETIIKASWNENGNNAHWRNRTDPDQPFFSIFNLMTSHQSRSMVWPEKQFVDQVQSKLTSDEIHDPNKAPIPPYYPDTPVVRKTVARYYDCVTAMDKEVGAILQQLNEDGLEKNTIIFFYSDHGSGMPRHKRVPLDSGMHVPLLVKFPAQYQSLMPPSEKGVSDRLVTFEDFGPTALSLAGIKPPEYMQGIPFLGQFNGKNRTFAFGHRDRIDEVIDMSRSVRNHRYLYVRNYMPHLTWNQQTAWPDQGEINHVFYQLGQDTTGLLQSPAQFHYTGPTKAREELYDCVTDPQNLFNLADSPQHYPILREMREAHLDYMEQSRDLGFLPELVLADIAKKQPPYSWALKSNYSPANHIRSAELVGTRNIREMITALNSSDPTIQFWGITALLALPTINDSAIHALADTMKMGHTANVIQSADALIRHNTEFKDDALSTLAGLLNHSDETTVLFAARTIEMLGDKASALVPHMKATAAKYNETTSDLVWYIQFSTQGFLSRMDQQD